MKRYNINLKEMLKFSSIFCILISLTHNEIRTLVISLIKKNYTLRKEERLPSDWQSEKKRQKAGGRGGDQVLLVKRVLVPQYHTGHVWYRQFSNGHLNRSISTTIFENEIFYLIFCVISSSHILMSGMISYERATMLILAVALFVTSGESLSST